MYHIRQPSRPPGFQSHSEGDDKDDDEVQDQTHAREAENLRGLDVGGLRVFIDALVPQPLSLMETISPKW